MNSINRNIEVTVETVDDFESKTLPTLDFQMWIGGKDDQLTQHTDGIRGDTVNYIFYENQVRAGGGSHISYRYQVST